MAAVVLDALAEAHLLHHLDVILRAHLDALRFEQLSFLLKPRHTLLHLLADFHDGFAQLVTGCDELLRGKNRVARHFERHRAGEHIHGADALDLIAEEFDADGLVFEVGGHHLDHIAPGAEFATLELVCRFARRAYPRAW
jgi:hypothetical protein